MRKTIVIVLLFIGVVLAFILLRGGDNQASKEITIGAILPLSGPGSFVGQELRDGMLLALKEVNQEKSKIHLVVEDSKSDPKEGVSIFQRLEGLHSIDFYVSSLSSVSMALAPLASQYQKPLVGLVVTAPKFTTESKWLFRYYPTAEEEIKPIIQILNSNNVGTLGVLYLNDDYGVSVFDLLNQRLVGGKKVIKGEKFLISDTDFKTQIQKLKNLEAVYVVGLDRHLKIIFSQLREVGYSGLVLGPSTGSLPSVVFDESSEGVYVAAPRIYDDSFQPASQLRKKYEKEYQKELSHYAANGYDFMKLFAGFLESGEKNTPQQGLERLLGNEYTGVFGKITFDQVRHEASFPLYPARIENSRVVYLD